MELYLQMGHGMQAMTQELVGVWGHGIVIISPVNIIQDKLSTFSEKIQSKGGQVIFDPQIFYPKDGKDKLQAYDYWPAEGMSVTSAEDNNSINKELLHLNTEISSSAIILPGIEITEENARDRIKLMKENAAFFSAESNKTLLATLYLYPETIRNRAFIEGLVEELKSIPVDGFYVIPHSPNSEYIVSDHLWSINMLKLLTCLKLANKKVIVGYTSHQGLIYSLANIDAIASGNYMNTRSFEPGKFKSNNDKDIKRKSTWYYLPSAFSEYKATLLDVAMQRGYIESFSTKGEFVNDYSAMLFKGAQPSSTNYNETNSFKHYLHCMKVQCEMLTKETYAETYDTYEFMLNSADNQVKELKKHGMTGENRDFAPAVETNRIAMCANNEDYGLKLKFDWK